MTPVSPLAHDILQQPLVSAGYVFAHGTTMRGMLEACGSLADWAAFARSWNDLELDTYLNVGDRDRRRRFAVYAAYPNGAIERQAHQPHYQAPNYNQLFGGIERWFAPIAQEVGDSATLVTIIRFCHRLFDALAPAAEPWHVEVHQFRIEARPERLGQPTPEGVHRDGVDFVLVLLVNRTNIVSGTTMTYDVHGNVLGSFTLTGACDAALVDDRRVSHGVTPVALQDASQPGHRDVLVVTFRRAGQRPSPHSDAV